MVLTLWIVIQLLIGITTASTTKSQSLKSYSSSASPSIDATCPFRTINYVTHALPQQCLATNLFPVGQNLQGTLQNWPARVNDSRTQSSSDPPTESTSPQATANTSGSFGASISSSAVNSSDTDVPGSTRSISVPDASTTTSPTHEEDSALESGNFLSFEEWKKQNLKKAGQSEHVGRRGSVELPEPRKRPVNVQNTLDSLGDDAEIDIDFTGFVPGGPEKGVHEATHPIAEISRGGNPDSRRIETKYRSKDAGTTCKERFNYASFDCAANILKTNREAKSPNTILLENKDSYMLNQCAAKDKFIILELCNDIEIDTIVLANFEFFSSTFRTFRVSVSDLYPVKAEKWISLGVYEARNSREIQAFLVENPAIWARYVRIDFLTHYGKEFYCPVSLLRIHGTSMLEDYKQGMGKEDDNEEDDSLQDEDSFIDNPAVTENIPIPPGLPATSIDEEQDISLPEGHDPLESKDVQDLKGIILVEAKVTDVTPPSVAAYEAISAVIDPSDTCVPKDSPTPTNLEHKTSNFPDVSVFDVPTLKKPKETTTISGSIEKSSPSTSTTSTTSSLKQNITEEVSPRNSNHTKVASATALKNSNSTVSTATTSSTKDRSSSSATERTRQSSTASQPLPATPTIQESFFKSVQKRLQMLEANSSLSLQYIEDQSRALRDAFKKVEQRQLSKTTAFLDQLNSTVLNELREFRQQYDQLWQSTVIQLEIQRERYERDNEAINARLSLLADEVIFQRRMGLLQMVLILVCLVLVLFSRGSINNYLELPLMQNMLARSPSTKWLNLSTRDSPVHSVKAGRAYGAYQSRNGIVKTHRRMQSEDSITDTQSGPETYVPLTPVSFDAQSDNEYFKEAKSPTSDFEQGDSGFDDLEFDPSTIERPSTSPPVLRVSDLSPVSEILHTSDEEIRDVQLSNGRRELLPEISNDLVSVEPQPSNIVLPTKHLTWNLPPA